MKIEVLTMGRRIKGCPPFLTMLAAGATAAGADVRLTATWTGWGDVLTMYGGGSPQKQTIIRAALAAGRRVVHWDLGYFSRGDKGDRHFFRCAIDGLHPSPDYVEGTPEDPSRFDEHGLKLSDDFNPDGPVIVIGLGHKSREGLNLYSWESKNLIAARARFPGRRIIYRPKPTNTGKPDGVGWDDIDGKTPLMALLRGASLVITRHSNCALDASVVGVPVETEDGIAKWLYSTTTHATRDQRLSLLRRAAWWQWRANETAAGWAFLLPRLSPARSAIG